ncbi:MAG: hypothetical protein L0215_01290, partial [Gemmataceae bacterium]|nr:hypothetical protein [Gemmataceae bacterium]
MEQIYCPDCLSPLTTSAICPVCSGSSTTPAKPVMGILASGKSRPVKSPSLAPVKSPSLTPVKSPSLAPVKSPSLAPVKSPSLARRASVDERASHQKENKSGLAWIALLVGGALLLVGGTTLAIVLGQQDATPPDDPPGLAFLDASSLDNLQKKIGSLPPKAAPPLNKQPALSSPSNQQFAKNNPPPLLLLDMPPPKFVAPGLSQERVNEAIAKGVKYLLST